MEKWTPTEEEAEDGWNDDITPDKPSYIDCTQYKYWVKYFSLATVACIPYMGCGFHVLPWIPYVPLTCIFICLGVINVRELNFIIVIGIAFRGIHISPLILIVNTSSMYISYWTPLLYAANKVKDVFMSKIEKLESLIPNAATIFINKQK
jgi:hypothetical protein